MSDKRIESFEEFWPFYVGEHSKKATRLFHFAGSTAGALALIAAIVKRRPELIPLGLVMGYGSAWFSHFFIENNRPASFKYPLWSFKADWIMWSKIIDGTMDAEVESVLAARQAAAHAGSNGQQGSHAYESHGSTVTSSELN